MAKPIIFKKKCDDLCFLFYFGSSSNLKAKFFLAEQQNEVFFYDTLKIKPGLLHLDHTVYGTGNYKRSLKIKINLKKRTIVTQYLC